VILGEAQEQEVACFEEKGVGKKKTTRAARSQANVLSGQSTERVEKHSKEKKREYKMRGKRE